MELSSNEPGCGKLPLTADMGLNVGAAFLAIRPTRALISACFCIYELRFTLPQMAWLGFFPSCYATLGIEITSVPVHLFEGL